MGIYELTEDVNVPSGLAIANPKYGDGGLEQFVIENYSNKLKLIGVIDLKE
jgi:hypothetical protein